MNRSKCKLKTCRKWHPTMGDIKDIKTYRESNCCKCNSKIITCVLENDVKPTRIRKGIVTVTKDERKDILALLQLEAEQ